MTYSHIHLTIHSHSHNLFTHIICLHIHLSSHSHAHNQYIHYHYLLTHALVNLSAHIQSIHTHYLSTHTLVNLFTYKHEAMQQADACMHIHTYTHVHIHAYMHPHIHVYAQLYTDRKSQQRRLIASSNIIDAHTWQRQGISPSLAHTDGKHVLGRWLPPPCAQVHCFRQHLMTFACLALIMTKTVQKTKID